MYAATPMQHGHGYGSFGDVGPMAYQADPNAIGKVMGVDMPQQSAFARRARPTNVATCASNVMLPWLIFACVYSLQSFSLHYTDPDTCRMLSYIAGGFVLLLGSFAFKALLRRGDDGAQDPRWYTFMFVSSAVAWILAMILGGANFTGNTAPFYDVTNLGVYRNIDPANYKGQQLMDAGRILFEPGSHLEIGRSMGFKNLDTYCVAPVVNHKNKTATVGVGGKAVEEYDFWAVGLNCCSGHQPDFHCGEYNNLNARAGLRLMRDDLRAYFRLAVQQAEAAYGIKASHPIFLYWMLDPSTEINAYEDASVKMWMVGVGAYFGVQLVAVILAAVAFSKMG